MIVPGFKKAGHDFIVLLKHIDILLGRDEHRPGALLAFDCSNRTVNHGFNHTDIMD